MAKLVLLHGGAETAYPLTSLPVEIGRHPECGIQLDSNMVSRRHARVSKDGDAYTIEDLGSGNGTLVNNELINRPTVINHGDRLKLGPLILRFDDPTDPDARPASEPKTGVFALDLIADEGSTIMGSADASGLSFLEDRPAVKLQGVLEISKSLAGTIDLQQLLPRILDTLFEIFPQADRGSILLRDQESGRIVPAAQKHRREGEDETVRMSRTVLDRVVTEKTAILSADAANDERFNAAESISNFSIRSMMCVPMLDLQGEVAGVINLDTNNPLKRFNEQDLNLLVAVAGQAALNYESTRLLEIYVKKQKQDSEMNIAKGVQRALLPDDLPSVPGYQFYASYDAAQAVGGDYYDCFMLGKDKVCISFGDVAGKGVPGALIMSRMSSVVQSTMSFTQDVTEAVRAINNQMCHKMVLGRFVTYVLAVLELETHRVTLVNAGHMSPLIRKPDGTVVEFNQVAIGIPIGIDEDFEYDAVSRVLDPGDTVVLVTDGVDEAMNPDSELYTKQRVIDFVSAGSADAAELGKALLADVRKHADGRDQNDDITIMTFGRDASSS